MSFECRLDDYTESLASYEDFIVSNNSSDCFLSYQALSKGEMLMRTSVRMKDLCVGDYFLPLFPSELLWSTSARAIAHLLLSLFSFIGVSLVSDKFMSAIEVITAKERTVHRFDDKGEKIETKVLIWNDTVANLSLMAFGSSAPEILLSLVESVKSISMQKQGNMEGADKDGLGPSTIVGSAAFNLLIITGVCIFSVPEGKVKRIEKYGVFIVTSLFSMFAYVWMYLILVVWTPDVINFTEAVITLAGFPALIFISYLQDINLLCCCFSNKAEKQVSPDQHLAVQHKNPFQQLTKKEIPFNRKNSLDICRKELHDLMVAEPGLNLEDQTAIAKLGAMRVALKGRVSRMKYRMQATRWMYGQRQVIVTESSFKKRLSKSSFDKENPSPVTPVQPTKPIIGFQTTSYRIFENQGPVNITIERTGSIDMLNQISTVSYESSNGRAVAGVDYEYSAGVLTFMPGEQAKIVSIGIIDDNEFEQDEEFYLVLKAPYENAEISDKHVAEITIIDDDNPGKFTFENENLTVKESTHVFTVDILRQGGVDGTVRIKYKTQDYTAKAEENYYPCTGVVTFLHGEAKKSVEIFLINSQSYDRSLVFGLTIEIVGFPECGATYGDHRMVNIYITSDEKFSENINELALLMQQNLEDMETEVSWKQQLVDSLKLFSDEDEGEETMSLLNCGIHFISLPFKVLTALVPPTSYCGGWMTFIVSLAFCGILTAVVGDMAGVFGCLMGIPPGITAITFVALGTSIPDMFASMFAAENDDTADAAVGNVTGSNSVNVFVGLGLPWTIATIILGEFRVKAGDLSSSVFIFLIVAVVLFGVLGFRRYFGFGELGGPKNVRLISGIACFCLWGVYILRSIVIYLNL